MKKDIHPNVQEVTYKCSCGSAFKEMSTIKDKEVFLDVCPKCHPFYTGKSKIMDTGRIKRYEEMMKKVGQKGKK